MCVHLRIRSQGPVLRVLSGVAGQRGWVSYVSVTKHASACVCVLLAFLSVCRDCAHISVIMMVHGDERIHFHMPCVCVCVCDTVGWSGPGAASVERNQFKAILRLRVRARAIACACGLRKQKWFSTEFTGWYACTRLTHGTLVRLHSVQSYWSLSEWGVGSLGRGSFARNGSELGVSI